MVVTGVPGATRRHPTGTLRAVMFERGLQLCCFRMAHMVKAQGEGHIHGTSCCLGCKLSAAEGFSWSNRAQLTLRSLHSCVLCTQQELFDKALMNVILPYLAPGGQRAGAASYVSAGTDVHVAPEAGGPAGAAGAAAMAGTATATSWGFAASGLGSGVGGGVQGAGAHGAEEDGEGVAAEEDVELVVEGEGKGEGKGEGRGAGAAR